jgi:ABC-type sulfate transport system substrate-binding protein
MATLDDVLQQSLNLNLPFPAATKQAAGLVDGVKTDVMVMNFSDKIMVTISQQGRLAHWVCLAEAQVKKSADLRIATCATWKPKSWHRWYAHYLRGHG